MVKRVHFIQILFESLNILFYHSVINVPPCILKQLKTELWIRIRPDLCIFLENRPDGKKRIKLHQKRGEMP